MKKKLLAATAIAGIMAMGASAATTTNLIDQWTFTSATPWVSDIQGKTMGNWDTNTFTTTTVPAAGLLRDATGGNSAGAYWGGIPSSDSLTLTVDIADIHHDQRDYWFEFLGTVGGNTRLDIDAYNGSISIDVWGAGTELSGPAIFNTNDYTGAISMQVTATWDFANSNLSYTVTGSGVGGPSFSDTQSMAADLSGIVSITQIRARGNTVGAGEYIDLDTVTIETMTTVEEPPPAGETVLLEQWNFDGTNTAEGVNGLIVSTFSNTPPNSVPSPGILRLETPGSSLGDGFNGLKAANIKKLIMEVDLADFLIGVGTTDGVPNGTGADIMRHEIITDGGVLKLELNSFGGNGQFAPDMEQGTGSTDDLDVTLLSWAEQTNESPMILTCTWDFENLEMTLETSGSAVSSTTVPAANLANVVNIWRYRTTSSTSLQYGSFQELNGVTIKYVPVADPDSYEFWITQYPGVGTATNRTDNPDGDAWSNIYEYGLNGNPTVSNTVIQPVFQRAGSSMEYIHVQRNDDTNLVYSLEITDDLVYGIWTNLGYTVSGVNTNTGIANFDTVTNSVPTDVKDQQFIKLIIE